MITPTFTPNDVLRQQATSYREAFRAAHQGSTARSRVAASIPLFVADTDEEAYRVGDALMTEYFRVWLDATESWNATRSKDYQSYTGMSYFLRGLTPTAWREAGSAMVGSPERVIDRLHEFQEAAGVDTILWQVDFGAACGEVAERSLRLFIDKVLPKVSDL